MAQTGLINLPAPSTDQVATSQPVAATAVNAASTGYEPKGFAVTSDQTVQGQLKNIVDAGSPLMKQAETRAMQKMNQRGLINSSIAVGAGQDAVIGAAFPIAQQDAKAYETASTNTVNAKNAALNFGASAENAASSQNAQAGTNVSLANADAQNKAAQDAAQAANARTTTVLNNQNQMAVAQLDSQTRTALSTTENQYKKLFQASNDASNMYNQAVQNIANISLSTTMSPEAKDAAVASQLKMLNESLRVTQEIAQQQAAAVNELNIEQFFQDLGPSLPAQVPSWLQSPPDWYNQPPPQPQSQPQV